MASTRARTAGGQAGRQKSARRGRPVVLPVDAAGMHEAGHDFFRAANGVWLTARVPPAFVTAPQTG
jgi:RNA:NAD 2'-phosphotransferase (TPT1/KptA family)